MSRILEFLATGEGTAKEVLEFKLGIEPTAFVTAVGFRVFVQKRYSVRTAGFLWFSDKSTRVFDCYLEL